jgi:outer membrane protein OmpA-like peptidoglycan-associated protein
MIKLLPLLVLFVSVIFSQVSLASESEEIWSCDIREKNGEASANFEPCFYGGAGLNITRLDPNRNETSWSLYSRDDDGWHIYGGYHFKPDWFAEINYFDLGTVRVRDLNPNLNRSGTIRYKAPVAMVGYYFNLPEKIDSYIPELPIDLFVKLGLSSLEANTRPSNIPINELSSVQVAFALGLEHRLHQNWKLRSEFKAFDIDAYTFNFSAAYIFGEKKVIRQEPEPQPEPIAEPEPVIALAVCNMFEGSLDGIVFKSGSDELTEGSKLNLQTTIDALNEYEALQLEIHAYTDSVGREAPNLELSKKRAASVKQFLVEQGILEDRLSSQGHGELSPIADNATPEGRALNRRVEISPVDKNSCGELKVEELEQAVCEIFDGSLKGVVFKSGSDQLTENSKTNLQTALDALLSVQSLEMDIHAYSDDVGKASSNLSLSEKRAASVRQYFIDKGVMEERLSSKGFGEENPMADNTTAEGRALNRRVELHPKDNKTCLEQEDTEVLEEDAQAIKETGTDINN